MAFGFDDIMSAGLDFASAEYFRDKASDEATANREFSHGEAAIQRGFQERMRATQYQTMVQDLRAAGLNPALAYMHGGAGTPVGAMGTGSSAAGVKAPQPSESLLRAQLQAQSAAQVDLMEAQADKERATADSLRGKTEPQQVSMAHMRQQIDESIERVGTLVAQAHAHWASAAQAEQMVKNLQAEVPRIEATVGQLKGLTSLQSGQLELVAKQIGKTVAETREIVQRVAENLPEVERALAKLKAAAQLADLPARETAGRLYADPILGAASTLLRAFNPLQGLFGR